MWAYKGPLFFRDVFIKDVGDIVKIIMVLFALMVVRISFAEPFFPIPINPSENETPGDFCSEEDKDFHEYRYPEKMVYCRRNVTSGTKNKIYVQYKVEIKCKHRYTIDHLVPLALGGNNSPENLWPEHVLVKQTRQALEQQLYEEVSQGKMTSDEAVQIILYEKRRLKLDLSHVSGCG